MMKFKCSYPLPDLKLGNINDQKKVDVIVFIVDLLATHKLIVENYIMRLPSDFECFLEPFVRLDALEDKEK